MLSHTSLLFLDTNLGVENTDGFNTSPEFLVSGRLSYLRLIS